jgi:hypothetical protein
MQSVMQSPLQDALHSLQPLYDASQLLTNPVIGDLMDWYNDPCRGSEEYFANRMCTMSSWLSPHYFISARPLRLHHTLHDKSPIKVPKEWTDDPEWSDPDIIRFCDLMERRPSDPNVMKYYSAQRHHINWIEQVYYIAPVDALLDLSIQMVGRADANPFVPETPEDKQGALLFLEPAHRRVMAFFISAISILMDNAASGTSCVVDPMTLFVRASHRLSVRGLLYCVPIDIFDHLMGVDPSKSTFRNHMTMCKKQGYHVDPKRFPRDSGYHAHGFLSFRDFADFVGKLQPRTHEPMICQQKALAAIRACNV